MIFLYSERWVHCCHLLCGKFVSFEKKKRHDVSLLRYVGVCCCQFFLFIFSSFFNENLILSFIQILLYPNFGFIQICYG